MNQLIKENHKRKAIIILFSLGLAFLFNLTLSQPAKAETASLYLSPASGTFFVGSTFDVSIFVNTEGNSINAVQVDLRFPPELLQVTSPTAGSSFISAWADQPFFSNREGLISFKGGVLAPGINTSAGLVSTVTFRAKAPGVANIYFLDSSKVLLADGKGTDILKTTVIGEYVLAIPSPEGPRITSPSHPSLTTWYRDNNPTFSWQRGSGVTDFSYTLDQDPTGIPDNISEGSQGSVTFNGVENGLSYFHIKAKKDGVWGRTSHYPLHIDATPPEEFKTDIRTISRLTGSRFFAYFSTDDLFSGIDHYEISVADLSDPKATINPFFVETTSPYRIPYELSGKYMVLVNAYDKAGNSTQEESILTIVSPFISYADKGIQIKDLFLDWWLVYLIIILITILISYAVYSLFKKKNLVKRLKKEVVEAEKEIEDVRKLEKKIKEMRIAEEETKKEEERLIKELRGKRDDEDEKKKNNSDNEIK
ncbi:MAG: cohesin domain-containing protein [Patescibacteria group bacterium]|nr:cohesin domain-containing protein [Patescibacteria group bacterium]